MMLIVFIYRFMLIITANDDYDSHLIIIALLPVIIQCKTCDYRIFFPVEEL